MEFKELKIKDTRLLNDKELGLISNLISEGKKLLKELRNEATYEKLRKTIKNYINKISDNKEIIESIIDRTLSVSPSLSITVNQLISNAQELINILKRAAIINKYGKPVINKLTRMLLKYKVIIKINPKINYWTNRSKCKKTKIILNINELTIKDLVILILNNFKNEITSSFLITEEDRIENSIINDFIKGLNDEELRIAINEEPAYAEFLIKLYIALRAQAQAIKNLSKKLNKLKPLNENELSASTALMRTELKKASNNLIKVLNLCSEARNKGVNTERLISKYNEKEIKNDAEDMIKSYLRINYQIKDLNKQLAYEFLTIYEAVPPELESYNDYEKRSRYLLLKDFFA